MSNDTDKITEKIREIHEKRRLEELARTTHSARELANKVAGSSEETAAVFDSGYRSSSELGQGSREDRG
jgi:hypothetical protein